MTESLPHKHVTPITDAVTVGHELLHVIEESIKAQPRSQQVRIGPSELGVPCTRRIGYKLRNKPEINLRAAPWKPTIGTAVHEHLEGVFDRFNLSNAVHLDGQERFYVETKVSVGDINGTEVTGTADLFDRVTLTNWDWKIVGPTQLTKYKRHGPGDQYRAQAHLYGRGWQRAGIGCGHVGIVFLPRNGELADAHIWTEPYDEQIAVDALTRVAGISLATDALGDEALPQLATADAWCTYCPYFQRGSDDPRRACPGDPESRANKKVPTNSQDYLGIT